ncbi:sugar-binding protein [Peribacillus cavernae]|nr:sugar-binding protein [Peribacillus cavernae]MDQ0218125.1 ribose transport system substrate-binding protein [Peribacillus cavernae]
MKRSVYFLLLLLFALNLFFMLYYGKETFQVQERVDPPHAYDYHFVLISEEIDNEYWRLIEKGARDAAKKNNVYLEYLGPKQVDNVEQLKFIDKAIAGKVDGMMVQGVAGPVFAQLVNKAFERGISVVTVDTDVADSERRAYVGSDNYQAGVIAGNALIKDTKGKQYVGIVTGRYEASNQQLRIKGFKDAIKQEHRIELVDMEESNITKSGALQATYDLLRAHPYLTAFYGTSAIDASGIAQVVNQFQLEPRPYIIGFDILPQTLSLLEKGFIDATVAQYPYEMGYQAVEALLQIKQGEKSKALQYTQTKVIHRDEIPAVHNREPNE